jgi:hypothetical protein
MMFPLFHASDPFVSGQPGIAVGILSRDTPQLPTDDMVAFLDVIADRICRQRPGTLAYVDDCATAPRLMLRLLMDKAEHITVELVRRQAAPQ